MSKYRFKTAKEFQDDNEFDYKNNVPNDWCKDGNMNEYMGQDVPDLYLYNIETDKDLRINGWFFKTTDVVLTDKPQSSNKQQYLLIQRKS